MRSSSIVVAVDRATHGTTRERAVMSSMCLAPKLGERCPEPAPRPSVAFAQVGRGSWVRACFFGWLAFRSRSSSCFGCCSSAKWKRLVRHPAGEPRHQDLALIRLRYLSASRRSRAITRGADWRGRVGASMHPRSTFRILLLAAMRPLSRSASGRRSRADLAGHREPGDKHAPHLAIDLKLAGVEVHAGEALLQGSAEWTRCPQPRSRVRRCGRSSGVPAPACG